MRMVSPAASGRSSGQAVVDFFVIRRVDFDPGVYQELEIVEGGCIRFVGDDGGEEQGRYRPYECSDSRFHLSLAVLDAFFLLSKWFDTVRSGSLSSAVVSTDCF